AQAIATQQVDTEGRLDLEILHMQPSAAAAKSGGGECGRRRAERRLDADDDVRPPDGALPDRHRCAADRKGEQMQDPPPCRARTLRDPDWTAINLDPAQPFAPVGAAAIGLVDAPLRIVG